jgi:hypothetical protein
MTKSTEEKTAKFESNLAKADRLFAANASEEVILKEYVAAYKAKGKTDKEWVAARAAIYMRIAERKATAAAAK